MRKATWRSQAPSGTMPGMRTSRLVTCLLVVAGSLSTGCPGAASSGGAEDEVPLTLLSAEYQVDITVVGSDCALSDRLANGFRGRAEVEQVGNAIIWRQYDLLDNGDVDTSRNWELRGQICPTDNGPVVKLRGARIARIADAERFCRADLRIPASDAVCPAMDDICSDPSTITLWLDPCADRMVSAFRTCVTYSESCQGQTQCRMAMQWDVFASDAAAGVISEDGMEMDACVSLDAPLPADDCTGNCSGVGADVS